MAGKQRGSRYLRGVSILAFDAWTGFSRRAHRGQSPVNFGMVRRAGNPINGMFGRKIARARGAR